MLISTHMQDLKDTTHDVHYENFRAQCISQISQHALRDRNKMQRESFSSNDTISETDRLLIQKDEEVCVYFPICISDLLSIRLQNTFEKRIKKKLLLLFLDSTNARQTRANAGKTQNERYFGNEQEKR